MADAKTPETARATYGGFSSSSQTVGGYTTMDSPSGQTTTRIVSDGVAGVRTFAGGYRSYTHGFEGGVVGGRPVYTIRDASHPPTYFGAISSRLHDEHENSYAFPTRAIHENCVVDTRVKGEVIVEEADQPIGLVRDQVIRVQSGFTAPVRRTYEPWTPPTVRVIEPRDLLSMYGSYQVVSEGQPVKRTVRDFPVRPLRVTRIDPPSLRIQERRDMFAHEPRFIKDIVPYRTCGYRVLEDRIVTDEAGRAVNPAPPVVEEGVIVEKGPVFSPLRTIDVVDLDHPIAKMMDEADAMYTIREGKVKQGQVLRVSENHHHGGSYVGQRVVRMGAHYPHLHGGSPLKTTVRTIRRNADGTTTTTVTSSDGTTTTEVKGKDS